MLPVQDELIPLLAKEDSGRFSKKNKGKAISVFSLTLEEKFVGVDAVGNAAPYERDEVKYHGRLMWIRKVELSNDIVGNCDDKNKTSR